MTDNATRRDLRSSLESRADFVRERLAVGIDNLRTRKRLLLDPAEEVRRHPTMTLAASAGIALVLGVGVAVATYRVSTRKERARRARWNAWMLLITRPERLVSKRRSLIVELLEKAAVAA